MRALLLAVCMSLTAVVLMTTSGRSSQEAPSPADQARMLELARPGSEHELLSKYAGTWLMEASMTMAPGAPVMKEEARATIGFDTLGTYSVSAEGGGR